MRTSASKSVRSGDEVDAERCMAVDEAVGLVRDKWTVLVVGVLGKRESLRYTELQRVVGISQRMLTLTLKSLEENGIVKRTVTPTVPPRVDYELTALGQSLFTVLGELVRWAQNNRLAMVDARRAYASRDDRVSRARRS